MSQPWIPAVLRALHSLASVIWVGGILTMALSILPAARRSLGRSSETQGLIQAIQDRMALIAAFCAAIAVATGLLLGRNAIYGGCPISSGYQTLLSIKVVLVGVMIVVALIQIRLAPASHAREKGGLLLLNSFLGVVVVILSSVAATLSRCD